MFCKIDRYYLDVYMIYIIVYLKLRNCSIGSVGETPSFFSPSHNPHQGHDGWSDARVYKAGKAQGTRDRHWGGAWYSWEQLGKKLKSIVSEAGILKNIRKRQDFNGFLWPIFNVFLVGNN